MKYPLQIELEKDLKESSNLLKQAHDSNDPNAITYALKYFDAINRINDLCVNRKRY